MSRQETTTGPSIDVRDHATPTAPAWERYGTPELGEYNSEHYAVPASAGDVLVVDDDGARFPSVTSSLWGYRGEGEPYVALGLGGGSSSSDTAVRLRLREAEQLAQQLQALVDAARAGGVL